MLNANQRNAEGAGVLVMEGFPFLVLALSLGLGRCCCCSCSCSSSGSLLMIKVVSCRGYESRCVSLSSVHLLWPRRSLFYSNI